MTPKECSRLVLPKHGRSVWQPSYLRAAALILCCNEQTAINRVVRDFRIAMLIVAVYIGAGANT